MRTIITATNLLLMGLSPALASQPGTPFGPEDVEILDPSIWVEELPEPFLTSYRELLSHDIYATMIPPWNLNPGEGTGAGSISPFPEISNRVSDVAGNIYIAQVYDSATQCGTYYYNGSTYPLMLLGIRIVRLDAVTGMKTTIAQLAGRCVNAAEPRLDYVNMGRQTHGGLYWDFPHARTGVAFYNATDGTMLWTFQGQLLCPRVTYGVCDSGWSSSFGWRIRGLPTIFEILSSYEPTGTTLAWRAPLMPFGLPSVAGDGFDVFKGDLASFQQAGAAAFEAAQPVACGVGSPGGYPVGARFEVPLPPMSTNGEYYLVAAKSGTERRYGRWKPEPGAPASGRDPQLLPDCSAESSGMTTAQP